jgi:uncharacterized membrane protein YdbT with pleckstrin-like domain
MSYVEQTLMPGENIISQATLHWAMFIAPIIVCVVGLLAMSGNGGPILLILGVVWLGWRFLVFQSTELAVTNRRVLAKSGIVRRHCIDVQNSKVEGLTYNQGLIGRLFGYGSIFVRGTGIGMVPIPYVAAPEAFKRDVSIAINAV